MDEDKTDLTILYKLGFMEFLLETDPEIKQRFISFIIAYQAQELDKIIVLNEARRILNDANNSNS